MGERRSDPEPNGHDPMMRWAEAHRRAAVVSFVLPSILLVAVPWALTGGSLTIVLPVSVVFGVAIGLVVRAELSSAGRVIRALDPSTRRMLSEALERGQAVSDANYAPLAADLAASRRRWDNIMFPSVPAILLLVQILYLLHLGRSFSQSVFAWRSLAVVLGVALFMLYPWRAWDTRLRRAEELNRGLGDNGGQAAARR